MTFKPPQLNGNNGGFPQLDKEQLTKLTVNTGPNNENLSTFPLRKGKNKQRCLFLSPSFNTALEILMSARRQERTKNHTNRKENK
jgi:hypothetical protein